MRIKPKFLSTTGAELLFEVFSQRYERGSVIVTSNLPFDEWTGVFGSERLTCAHGWGAAGLRQFHAA
jgi:DNA replication protein DnaC